MEIIRILGRLFPAVMQVARGIHDARQKGSPGDERVIAQEIGAIAMRFMSDIAPVVQDELETAPREK